MKKKNTTYLKLQIFLSLSVIYIYIYINIYKYIYKFINIYKFIVFLDFSNIISTVTDVKNPM